MQILERLAGKQASSAIGGTDQRFAVRCRCGRVSEGVRQPKPQVVICSGCQEPLFVMSQSALPRPTGLDSDSKRGRRKIRPSASAESERTAAPPVWRLRPQVALAAVALLVGATTYWGWHAQRRARFSAELESAMTDGRQALAKGDLLTASQRLEVADRAARGLGLTTSTERRAVNLFAEAQIWLDLSPRSMEDFFLARARRATPWDASSAEFEFAQDYRGRTLIVDGWVTRTERWVTPPPGNRRHKVDAPQPKQTFVPVLDWGLAGETYRAELDLRHISRLDHLPPRESARVVFGVTIAGLQRASDDPQKWLIQVEPDSLVLLTVEEPLLRSGWPEHDDDLADVLSRQRAAVERVP